MEERKEEVRRRDEWMEDKEEEKRREESVHTDRRGEK